MPKIRIIFSKPIEIRIKLEFFMEIGSGLKSLVES